MTETKKLGFAGSYKCDLILYLSRILLAAGKRVAIVDATDEQLFHYCLPLTSLSDCVFTYRDIDVYYRIKNEDDYRSTVKEEYDVLLIDAGFNRSMVEVLKRTDYCIFVTDPEIHNVHKLKDFISAFSGSAKQIEENNGAQLVRIFRDMLQGKINYKYISSVLDLPSPLNYIGEYVFLLDETDRRQRLHCQYDHIFKFNKLSKEYKMLFGDMLEVFFGMDRKQIKKAIRKAERGR